MSAFASEVWGRTSNAPGSFVFEHQAPIAQLRAPSMPAQGRKRRYPGVILLGRVYKSES